MPQTRVVVLTVLAMLAFAANSLLCRSALRSTSIDPATFTAIRLVSGASVLAVIVAIRGRARLGGNWWSALALLRSPGELGCDIACGDAQSFEVPIAGTISVRVEERGTGAPASDVPGTGAQAVTDYRQAIDLPGVMSRKKQVAPKLLSAL